MKRTVYALPLLVGSVGLFGGQAALADGHNRTPVEVLEGLIEATDSPYLSQSDQNMMMMADNPAHWTAEDGKKLFHAKRGPNNKSLESCDFGKGPGKLEGAFVETPRYFADTGKVMTAETRLIHCMKTIQGFEKGNPELQGRYKGGSDIVKILTYVAEQSNGMAYAPPMDHPMEKAMRDAGEVLFYRRAGTHDFSCATCHSKTGGRIRASVLPNIHEPEEWTKAASWPAYRVGKNEVRSRMKRVRGCYYQMRQPGVVAGGDASTAMISFWMDTARGQPAILPDMKR